jgi:hypothetical protein
MFTMRTAFISGHLSVTPEEFAANYTAQLDAAIEAGDNFVIGDAVGADAMAQEYLAARVSKERVTVNLGGHGSAVSLRFKRVFNCV